MVLSESAKFQFSRRLFPEAWRRTLTIQSLKPEKNLEINAIFILTLQFKHDKDEEKSIRTINFISID